MWPARAAIRPVPAHAVVPADVVEDVEQELGSADDLEAAIDRALDEMEHAQPSLAAFFDRELDGVNDDTAEALGGFLAVSVVKAFATAFGPRLRRVDESALELARTTFDWDEELRRGAADEVLESDDVVAIGQPHLVAFVREQLEAALEPDEDGETPDVDLDAVARVYRASLIAIVALSAAVVPPRGVASTENLA